MQQTGAIWLIGMMGTGKSTVGRALAARLGRPFLDLDEAIAERAGRPIPEIFARDGEAGFRILEAALLEERARQPDDAVIAAGGGAWLREPARAAMRRSGIVVWLRATVEEILPSLDVPSRPLLAGARDPRPLLEQIARERAPIYAAADVTIDRLGRSAEAVADEIVARLADLGPGPLAAPDNARVEVALGERSYPILFEPENDGGAARFAAHLARRAPPGRAVVGLISDENVARLHLPRYLAALQHLGYRVAPTIVPAGEAAKTLAVAEGVAEALVRGGLDRRSTVIALGGGVVGDLAGFVAALLFRGVPVVQVATSLLAQVDSSVGGKTGVNLPSGKNLIGAFHQPAMVWSDLAALATLPPREIASGLGEVVKHALLAAPGDPEATMLDLLEADAERARAADPAILAELVAASCRIKARVVASDERELSTTGGRLLLNLGHTVGHALETASHHRGDPLAHGEAVALGLLAAARVGLAIAPTDGDRALEARLIALLSRLGLPVDLDRRLAEPGALGAVSVDKKRAGQTVRYVALPRPGAPRVVLLTPEKLAEILRYANPPRYDGPEVSR